MAPEIETLLDRVEEKYGKKPETTSDFEELSYYLGYEKYGSVSASTLKRLWGYVSDTRQPRVATLDLLSRYVGFRSFSHFLKDLKTSTLYNSSFFTAQQVASADLTPGDEVIIGWAPDRTLRLLYLGESIYEITEARNSKLRVGDRFMTGCFFKDVPLYLPYILRDGKHTSPFIAGRNGGISCLKIVKK